MIHALRYLAAVLVVIGVGATRTEATPILLTIPASGAIGGTAGNTIGWGYEITNDDPLRWLVTTAVNADSFQFGIPDSGVFNFPIVAPGATVVQPFDLLNFLGLYAFSWDPGAPTGFVNSGTFVVQSEWWDADPFAGGSFSAAGPDLSAAYSVTVASVPPVTPVPEPASLTLIVAGALAAAARRSRQRFSAPSRYRTRLPDRR